MIDSNTPSSRISRSALAAVLDSAFVALFNEMAFADVWRLDEGLEDEVRHACTVRCVLPVKGVWEGELLLASDTQTLTDLAAGYHSLPNGHIDDAVRADFLAEAGQLLSKELSMASLTGGGIEVGEPRLVDAAEAERLWALAAGFVAVFGCNESGRLAVAVALAD